MVVFFWIICVLICYPLVLYPLSLRIISKFYKKKEFEGFKEEEYPEVSFIVTVYNEEKVIEKKLNNIIETDYDRNKLEIIVASDDSNDATHEIVEDFIEKHKEFNIKLHIVKGRKGKTVVQNQVTHIANGSICVYSDANSMWRPDAIRKLVDCFQDEKMGYVSGKLQYENGKDNLTSGSESKYWNFDLKIRSMESQIGNIVGGNGSIYAIAKKYYVDLDPMLSHDGFMPTKMVLQGAKAKYQENAIAYEKASEVSGDEFARKVRMQRGQPFKKYYDIQKFNVFRHGWFSYFYFGHKYLKYLLYLFHILLYGTNLLLIKEKLFYKITFVLQTMFYVFAVIGFFTRKRKIRIFYYPYHYCMTIVAQVVSMVNTFRGKKFVTWEKSETTR